jgi:hypothetical protein
MQSLDQGFFEVLNPYNQTATRITADPLQIHSIVFWSKNFGPFIRHGYDRALVKRGYRLFFNFSINSPDPLLEPNLPPLAQRLEQLAYLARQFGGRCIQWRFDPVCLYQKSDLRLQDNLERFADIARSAAAANVPVCITSFVDLYRKVLRRMAKHPEVAFVDPPVDKKTALFNKMQHTLRQLGLELHLCCEKQIIDTLPPESSLQAAACIPGHRLVELYGPGLSLRKDPGQRAAAGCGCTVSKDIGSYALHPCFHNCLYCYANPADPAG